MSRYLPLALSKFESIYSTWLRAIGTIQTVVVPTQAGSDSESQAQAHWQAVAKLLAG